MRPAKYRRMNSPATPHQSSTIDDLPVEMICELFKRLHPKDLIVCSMVSKRWHSIYSHFKLDRLVVMDNLHLYLSNKCFPDRRVENQELCDQKLFGRLMGNTLLSNVKCLAVCGFSFEYDLNRLNQFRHLLHLEINLSLVKINVSLTFSYLKFLAFHQFSKCCLLSIDCPQLSTLICRGDYGGLLRMKHPKTIRHLEIGHLLDAELFEGVECLVTNELKVITGETVKRLPKLKEMRYDRSVDSALDWYGFPEQIRRTIREFLVDARSLRGADFKFRFCGLQLAATLAEIDLNVRTGESLCNESVYANNYYLIEPAATMDFLDTVDYNRLMRCASEKSLAEKFPSISWVQVNGAVQDASHLLKFLKSLQFLSRLHLVSPRLSQTFYIELPSSASSLIDLYLCEHQDRVLCMSFEFVSQLPRLSRLQIGDDLSLESTISLVRSFGQTAEGSLSFGLQGKRFAILKSKIFQVKKLFGDGRTLLWTEDPDKMIHFFERL